MRRFECVKAPGIYFERLRILTVIRIIMSDEMRWDGSINVCLRVKINAYGVLAGKPMGRKIVNGLRRGWGVWARLASCSSR
jgi:hypothetical protein